jgi:hypothetical protein
MHTKLEASGSRANILDFLDVKASMISANVCKCCCNLRINTTCTIQLIDEHCEAVKKRGKIFSHF